MFKTPTAVLEANRRYRARQLLENPDAWRAKGREYVKQHRIKKISIVDNSDVFELLISNFNKLDKTTRVPTRAGKIPDIEKDWIEYIFNLDYYDTQNWDTILQETDEPKKKIMYTNKYFYNTIRILRYLFKKDDNTLDKEKINLVINAYNYSRISDEVRKAENIKFNLRDNERSKKNISLGKDVVKKINNYLNTNDRNIVLLNFIKEIQKLLLTLADIRTEFIENGVVCYFHWIKKLFGQCYYNYLKELSNNSCLPISLKTHRDSYLQNNKLRDEKIKIDMLYPEILPMLLISERKINVVIDETRNVYFNSCGESNLFNLLKYLLYDERENKITIEKLSILDRISRTKIIFSEIFIETFSQLNTDIEQTKYLEDKLQSFALLISTVSNPENVNEEIYNINGLIENSVSF